MGFVTASRRAGIDLSGLQAYMDQAPKTIMSIQYDDAGAERFQEIAKLAQLFHDATGIFGLADANGSGSGDISFRLR